MVRSIDQLETLFDSFSPSLPETRVRENRLERMVRLLDRLGHPEESFRTYHTAGSKGKGTTSLYLASLIEGYGRKCGLYTSPHMYTVRERFMLPSGFFPSDLYIDTANDLMERIEGFTLPDSLGAPAPTTFEMYTAFGYMLFKAAGCTDAVIETGLGGRLDATNTLSPEAVLLTPIELEHTAVLGDTIEKIAGEKAKIIKPGIPVFVSRQRPEAMEVFRKEAEVQSAPLFSFDDFISDFSSSTDRSGEDVSFVLDGKPFRLRLSMTTEAMAENAALAILTASRLSLLSEKGLENLETASLPGRFEKTDIEGHLVVVDGAHTVNSVSSVRDAFLSVTDDPESSVLIFGAIEGKDIEHMLSVLLPPFSEVIITKPGSYRKSDTGKIFEMARSFFPEKSVRLVENPDEALGIALDSGHDILITGSFYLPSEMKMLRRMHES